MMGRPQFANRQNWLTCSECDGRAFSDATKEFHWPDCSKYKAWRTGKGKPLAWEIERQDREAATLRELRAPFVTHHMTDERPCLDPYCEGCDEAMKRLLRDVGALP